MSSRWIHCNCFNHCRGMLGRLNDEKDRIIERLATCLCGTSAVLSGSINSLVTDENTRERQVWLIKPYDHTYVAIGRGLKIIILYTFNAVVISSPCPTSLHDSNRIANKPP